MDTETQQLIIKILGAIAVISLVEVMVLITIMPTVSDTITAQILLITGNAIGMLGGFVAGKSLTEKQSEYLEQVSCDMQ